MKKIISITIIIGIIISCFSFVFAANTYELEFKTVNNAKNKKINLYILLPKEYIEFAIREAGLNINYEGVNTLKKYDIPGILVDKSKIDDETYKNDGIEYVQILLDENENNVYIFDILENYLELNIKYRIKNDEKDYIVHIDNFKVEKGKCEIEYNYDNNIVKQPDKIIVPKGVIILIIILVIVLVIGGISKIKS